MAFPWGALISAGTSLFLGTRKPKPAPAPGVDYERLVADAQAAGFNPLTALMYGGAQSYTRDYGPALSRMQNVGQAMANFSQQLADHQVHLDRLSLDRDYFGLERKRLAMDQRLVDAQIAGIQSGPVFGPSARTLPWGPAYGHAERYQEVLDAYGPTAANFDGLGRAVIDTAYQTGATVGGWLRDSFRNLWQRQSLHNFVNLPGGPNLGNRPGPTGGPLQITITR